MGKRDLIDLLCLSSWCLLIVVRLFLTMPLVCLQFVIVVLPNYIHYCWLSKRWLSYEGLTVLEKIKEFDSNPEVKPIHKTIRQFLHMVRVMCL